MLSGTLIFIPGYTCRRSILLKRATSSQSLPNIDSRVSFGLMNRPCHLMFFWLGYSTLVRSSFAGSSGLGPGSAVLEGLYRSAVDMITSARATGMILDIFTASSRCLRPRLNECAVQHFFYRRVWI